MSKIYTSADQLIGRTPLLELTNIEKKYNLKARILAKVEYFNPAGSVKDRVALSMINDAEEAGILKPDGVYHAGGALRYSRGRIAEARLFRRALERKSPEAVYVIELSEFVSVAEGAGRRDNGIVELFAAKIHAQSAHIISSLSITGPSLQILLLPVSVLHEQPMHAPNPQPMRSSKLYCPGVFMILCIARNIGSGPQV